jgi:nicotinate-nucleotide pyrophosphorylase (carboxylating)
VYRLLLDNFKPEELKELLKSIPEEIQTEASGGITIENVVDFAETGVGYISMGALTHSVRNLDMSLKAIF